MTILNVNLPRYYRRDSSFFTYDSAEWAQSGIPLDENCVVHQTPVGRYFISSMFLGGVDFNLMSTIRPEEAVPLLFGTHIFDLQAKTNDRAILGHFYHHDEVETRIFHSLVVGKYRLELELPHGESTRS